jgi:hypothetical protein
VTDGRSTRWSSECGEPALSADAGRASLEIVFGFLLTVLMLLLADMGFFLFREFMVPASLQVCCCGKRIIGTSPAVNVT